MSDETKVFFVDTNAFLQVRDLKDIPWNELFHGVKAIDLMVAPSVINELDPQSFIYSSKATQTKVLLAGLLN
jgi:hypothetical protein